MAGKEREKDSEEESEDVAVLQTGREEARTVLDHQIRLLSEMHTKALRTVRITVLVLGVILSSTAFPGTRQFVNWLTIGGVASLVVAIVSGLVAYTASDPSFGTSPEYLSDVRTNDYDETAWLGTLLEGYEDWIRSMEELNDGNARLLTYTQVFLGLGVLLVATGIFSVSVT